MRVGFIGLGNMGNLMATNVLKAGYNLTIYDVRRETGQNLEEAGAEWIDSPKKVANQSDVVLTSLPGPREVEAVVLGEDGIFVGLNVGSAYIDMSTNAPTVARKIAEIGTAKGFRTLDAPISGGVLGAKDATLTIFVGGENVNFEQFQPLLQSMGTNVVHMGPAGSGSVTKLVNNTMMFINLMAACEGLAMGAKAGIHPQALYDVIITSMGQSMALERHVQLSLKDELMFSTIDLAAKDMHLGLELAKEMGTPLELTSLVDTAFTQLCDDGLGQGDQTDIVREFMRQAGVDLSRS